MEILVAVIMLFSIYNYKKDSSSVVLLDNGKSKNGIIVDTKKEKRNLNKINTYATLNKNAKISKVKEISQEKLEKKYGNILSYEAEKPTSMLFYFTSGTKLDEKSRKKLFFLKREIQKREPASVTIIGHSDTLGKEEANVKLSLQRARTIEQWLIKNHIKTKELFIESYGENDLLVFTKDGVKEPLNRRVEVLIR